MSATDASCASAPRTRRWAARPRRSATSSKGQITFAAYLGNSLRYDVELAPGLIFKVDVRDPWHHELLPTGSTVAVSFPASSTIAIMEER